MMMRLQIITGFIVMTGSFILAISHSDAQIAALAKATAVLSLIFMIRAMSKAGQTHKTVPAKAKKVREQPRQIREMQKEPTMNLT